MQSTRLVVAIFPLVMVVLGAGGASAQDYPNRTIRILTAAAGGSSDLVARPIAQGFTDSMRQPVVIYNRPSILGSEIVSKASPDGYTLLISSESLWTRPLLDKVPYDFATGFTPVGQISREVYVLAVHPSLPVKSVRQLIALAKAKPGALNYGTGPNGSATHLSGELFRSLAGIKIVQVPYKGVAESVTAMISGEVHMMFANPSLVAPHAKVGRLRTLAVTTAEPTALVPGLPTVAASGLPGYESISVQGLLAPGKTPAAIVNRLNQEMVRVLNQPGLKEKFLNNGSELLGSSPERFAAFIASDMARMGKVIKDAGIKAN